MKKNHCDLCGELIPDPKQDYGPDGASEQEALPVDGGKMDGLMVGLTIGVDPMPNSSGEVRHVCIACTAGLVMDWLCLEPPQ